MEQAHSELISQFSQAGLVELYLLSTLTWRESDLGALQEVVRFQADDGLGTLRLQILSALRHKSSVFEAYDRTGFLDLLADGLVELSTHSDAYSADAVAALRVLCQDDELNRTEPGYALTLLMLLVRREVDLVNPQTLDEVIELVDALSTNPRLMEDNDSLAAFCDVLTGLYTLVGDRSALGRVLKVVDEALDKDSVAGEVYTRLLDFSAFATLALNGPALDETDLRKIISRFEALIAISPSDMPLAPAYDHLYTHLRSLWRATGDENLLRRQQEALSLAIEAHTPDDSPAKQYGRARALMGLVLGLDSMSRIEDIDVASLDWALLDRAARVALHSCPLEEIGQLSEVLAGLASVCLHRHRVTGDEAPLAEARLFLEESLNLTEPSDPARGMRAAVLAECLVLQDGFTPDSVPDGLAWVFDQSLDLYYVEANEKKAISLTQYAHVLGNIYERSGDIGMLRRAYEMMEEAVWITPTDSEWRALRLSNLAAHALQLHRREPSDVLIARAFEAAEEAVDRDDPDAAIKAKALHNLGGILLRLGNQTHDQAMLRRADSLIQRALQQDLQPEDRAVLLVSASSLYAALPEPGDAWPTRQYAALEEAVRLASPQSPVEAEALTRFIPAILGRGANSRDAKLLQHGLSLVDRVIQIVATLRGPLDLYTRGGPELVRVLAILTFQEGARSIDARDIWRRVAWLGVSLVDGLRYRGLAVGTDAWDQFDRRLELRAEYNGIGALAAWAFLRIAEDLDEGEAVVRSLDVLESSLSVATDELASSLRRATVTDPAAQRIADRITRLQASLASGTVPAPFESTERRPIDLGFRPEVSATPDQLHKMTTELRRAVDEVEKVADPAIGGSVSLERLVAYVAASERALVWLTTVDLGKELGPYRFSFPGLCYILRPDERLEVVTQPRLTGKVVEHLRAACIRDSSAAASASTDGRSLLRNGESPNIGPGLFTDFNSAMLTLPSLFGPEPDDLFTGDFDIVAAGLLHQLPLESAATRARISVSASRLVRPESRAPVGWQARALVVANPDLSLPGAKIEGECLASQLAGTVLVGSPGVPIGKDVFIEAVAAEAPIVVHLASHGLREQLITFGIMAQQVDTENSSLVERHFGLGDFRYIEQALQHVWLIFINCCFSGSSRPGLEDDAVSFATAALSCGVGAAIAPRWPVNDFGAAAFAVAFYENLAICDGDLRRAFVRTQRTSPEPHTAYAYVLLT